MPTKKLPKMGNKVQDTLSGFVGHVMAISHRPNAATMYGVQPLAKKGATEMPKATYIDGVTLKVIGEGVPVCTPDDRVLIGLGDQVEDKVTGLVGIVTEVATFINGCVHLFVVGRLDVGKDEAPISYAQHDRFKLLMPASQLFKAEHGEAAPQPLNEESFKEAQVSRPGGPSRDVIRP